jgi:hypothetical protein
MEGPLSDEKTGMSFTIAAGPRQRSHIYDLWILGLIFLHDFNAVFWWPLFCLKPLIPLINAYKSRFYLTFLPRHISYTKPNRFILCRETVAVYCENHTEHTNIVRTSQETHHISAT